MGDLNSPENAAQLNGPERPLPKGPEVRRPENPVGQLEQNIIRRIQQDGGPDQVLQDIAATGTPEQPLATNPLQQQMESGNPFGLTEGQMMKLSGRAIKIGEYPNARFREVRAEATEQNSAPQQTNETQAKDSQEKPRQNNAEINSLGQQDFTDLVKRYNAFMDQAYRAGNKDQYDALRRLPIGAVMNGWTPGNANAAEIARAGYIQVKQALDSFGNVTVSTPEYQPNAQQRPSPTLEYKPVKRPDGAFVFYKEGDTNPAFGYEKGTLDLSLPSDHPVNIFVDRRIPGQAMYSPEVRGFVLGGSTAEELENPAKTAEAWYTPEQRAKYFLKHEYTHFSWDQLPPEDMSRVIGIFSKPDFEDAARAFGQVMAEKPNYLEGKYKAEENLPESDVLNLTTNGQEVRVRKDNYINELLAHAVVGEMMSPQDLANLRKDDPNYDNFRRRSQEAIDCLNLIKQKSPEDYALLVKYGLVNNQDFEKDFPAIKAAAINLNKTNASGSAT